MKIKRIIHVATTSLMMVAAIALPALVVSASVQPGVVYAATGGTDTKKGVQDGVNSVGGSGQTGLGDLIKNIINIILYIVGVAAVIMIVVGGLRYVVSGGDSNAINGAKNTILYAVIGLIVAIMAYAIVNFVLGAIK